MTTDHRAADVSRKITESKIFRWLTIVSVVGALLGLALAIPDVRSRVFNEEPNLVVRLDNAIPVLGINREVSGLTVTYEGQDLLQSGQELTAIRITIENSGGESFGPADVSENDPIGFSLNGAEIVRMTQYSASTNHLRRFGSPKVSSNRVFISPKVIIDDGDALQFDLLVLISEGDDLNVDPLGKIAGVDAIEFVDGTEVEEIGFWERVVSGSLLIQFVRTVIYTIAMILLVVFVVGVLSQIEELKNSLAAKRRSKIVKEIRSTYAGENIDEVSFLLDQYAERGGDIIDVLVEAVESNGKIPKNYMHPPSLLKSDGDLAQVEAFEAMYHRAGRSMLVPASFIRMSRDAGFIDQDMKLSESFSGSVIFVSNAIKE